MRPGDLAKIGRMVLARGEWQGRQVVPADWVAESLRPHIATGDGLGYGYQWWTGTVAWQGRALEWSAGFRNGGQRLMSLASSETRNRTAAATSLGWPKRRSGVMRFGLKSTVSLLLVC